MPFSKKDIRAISDSQSYVRGEEYYEDGLVEIIKLTGSFVQAAVSGSNDYKVKVNLNDIDDYSCTCPYDWGGACKHVVAVLLAVLNEKESTDIKNKTFEESPDDILKRTPPEKLRKFIKKEMDDDSDLKERFLILFGETKIKNQTVEGYKKKMIKSMEEYDRYNRYVFYNTPDFDRYYKEAGLWLSKNLPLEALKIYQAASESIAEISGSVDDSYGDFSGEFEYAVDEFAGIAADLDLPEKKKVMEYLFGKYIQNEPDYYREHYEDALSAVSTGREELLYWEELLKPHFDRIPREGIEEISYQQYDMLSSWLWIQEQLGRKDEIDRIYESYYRVSGSIFMKYLDKLIETEKLERAKDIAEEREPHLFPRAQTAALEFLASYYKGKDWERYYGKMESLFKGNTGWHYYDEMKRTLPFEMWEKKLPGLIEYVKAKTSYSSLVELYIRENRKSDALEVLLKNAWAEPLAEYQKALGDVNPPAYFEAFKKAVLPQTKNASSRGHYQRVAALLKSMKKLKGMEKEFQKFTEEIRLNNARRPAFLEELKRI